MKISCRASLFFALVASTFAWPARGDEAAPTVSTFTGDFERGDLSGGWGNRDMARSDSIQVVANPVRAGRYAAKFTVRAGEIINNGNRAEIVRQNNDKAGSEAWYAWSFMIPRDFPDVEWKPKLWQCLGQWHDQPDPARGETWDNLPSHSPSIAVYYTSKNGVSALEVWYGTYQKGETQKIIATAPVRKGEWLDLMFHIRWSQGNDGFVAPFLNGKPLIAPDGSCHRACGRNMWNGVPHYLKIGLYRSSAITSTNSVYFDEVRIGPSRASVALPALEAPRP